MDEPLRVVDEDLPKAPPIVYDVALFESLNEAYADRPLVPAPTRYDPASLRERAHRRLLNVHRAIDLSGKRVLEFGCGGGHETWTISHTFGGEAWGIDIAARNTWPHFSDERTHYVQADIARDQPFAPDFFDRIVSFTVFEHVEHPFASLAELFRVLKPGGRAYISANLHRGAQASHRYREVNFPYPHLLFTDEVFREFYRRRGSRERTAAWVNHLTWSQYRDYFEWIGYRLVRVSFTERALDEAFYQRFEDVLGRYPRIDLTRDFFTAVLEKPRRRR